MTPYAVHRSVINPSTKKSEQKTEWKTKVEDRENFIKTFGEKRFKQVCKEDPKFAELDFLPFPEGFNWIVQQFLKIWRHCEIDINGNRIFTPRTIIDYCNCFGINLNYHERQFIIKMKEWVVEAIAQLKSEKEKS